MAHLLDFFNTNTFVGLITLLVGSFALYLYNKGKSDFKREAAGILLYEIENAERLLKTAKENLAANPPILSENQLLVPTESWSKYKFLFVRDLARDEWDGLNDFYNRCFLYDNAVKYNNSFFTKNEEQLRVNKQRVLTGYLKKHVEAQVGKDVPEADKISRISDEFDKQFMNNPSLLFYSPQKPIMDAQNAVRNINAAISLGIIGTKLKILSKHSRFVAKFLLMLSGGN